MALQDFKCILIAYLMLVFDCSKFMTDVEPSVLFLLQNATIQLMGSATALPQAPTEKTVFVEDLTDQQLATQVRALYNCYDNTLVLYC